MGGVVALGFGLIVACRDDEVLSTPLAPVVPNIDAEAVELGPRETAMTIALEAAPELEGRRWRVRAEVPDTAMVLGEWTIASSEEIEVEPPPQRSTVPLRITLETEEEPRRVVRVMRTQLVEGRRQLAYFYVDPICADAALPCPADQSCADTICRPNDVGLLPLYTSGWRQYPPDACATGDTRSLDVGRARGSFFDRPIEEEEELALECDPGTGLHYLPLALRTSAVRQRAVLFVTATFPEEGVLAPIAWREAVRLIPSPPPSTACDLAPVRLFVDESGASFESYLGQTMDLEAGFEATRDVVLARRRIRIAQNPSPATCPSP